MNQDQFCMVGELSLAIFNNDAESYVKVVQSITNRSDKKSGSIASQVRLMTANERTGEPLAEDEQHIQLMEMGRDQGHAWDNIGGMTTLAQALLVQGTKVDPVTGAYSTANNAVTAFDYLDDRLLAGTQYLLKKHLGLEVPWTTADSGKIGIWSSPNMNQTGRFDPYIGLIYNYYKYVKQVDMTQDKYKYLAYCYEYAMPESVDGQQNYISAGTLISTPDAAKKDGMGNERTLDDVPAVSAATSGFNSVNVTWNTDPQSMYLLWRSTSENGNYVLVNTTETIDGNDYKAQGNTVTYEDKNLKENVTYYYKVQVARKGTWSNIASALTSSNGAIKLESEDYGLSVGKTHKSQLYSIRSNGRKVRVDNTKVQWSSSDNQVASVNDQGVVTGKAQGKAVISAAYEGKTYSVNVTVVKDASLRLHYTFDHDDNTTAVDSAGYDNNGTIVDGSVSTADATDSFVSHTEGANAETLGTKDKALTFSGDPDSARAPMSICRTALPRD